MPDVKTTPSICERLRKVVGEPIGAGLARNWLANPDGLEAATLIETQAALLEEATDALEVAVDAAVWPTWADGKKARATLAKLKERRDG